MPPGATVQSGTTNTAPFSLDQQLLPVNNFTKGAAKSWSDHKVIHCNALLYNGAGPSPAMVGLPLIAQGKKQRGE